MTMLKYSAPADGEMKLDFEANSKRFAALIESGDIDDELLNAFKYVTANVSREAVGRACPVRAFADIVQVCNANPGGSCLCGGSLSQLHLEWNPARSALDAGKISFFLAEYTTLTSLLKSVGTIIINSAVWAGESFNALIRVTKDAEVHLMCLIAYWAQDEKINAALADLTFDFQNVGLGTKQKTATLRQLDNEEKLKTVSGISGCRRVVLYADLAEAMQQEGRCAGQGCEAARLLALMKEDDLDVKHIQTDTMARYIALGRRCLTPSVKKLLMQWESLCKRDCLIDPVTTLRGTFTASDNDDDLCYILQTLMLQQRSGLRRQLITPKSHNDNRTPANVAKSILLRKNILNHMSQSMPQWQALIAPYMGTSIYLDMYGINAHGVRVGEAVDDLENTDEDDDDKAAEAELSSYKSRHILMTLLKKLNKNMFEKILCNMARTMVLGRLDLSTDAAKPIKAILDNLLNAYADDFPKPPAADPSPAVITHNTTNNEEPLTVLTSKPFTQDEYNMQLKAYQQNVADYEKNKCDVYIRSRVEILVDKKEDMNRLKRKMTSLPVLTEKKRKLFVHDEMCAKAVSWARVINQKGSMFAPLKQTMNDSTLDSVMELYTAFRTENDNKESDDAIAVIVPGALPNSPINKNVQVTHAVLSKAVPKLQPPKIGVIHLRETDLLARNRSKTAFSGHYQHNILFTKQTKHSYQRKAMANLGGDNLFNKWDVPAIPLAKMMKLPQEQFDKVTELLSETADFEDGDEYAVQCSADELALQNELPPFPHENDMALGKELIDTFDPNVVIVTHPGMGEMLKAVLFKQKYGVAICNTTTHKAVVMDHLREWVKSMNLITFTDGPVKSVEMAKFEKEHGGKLMPNFVNVKLNLSPAKLMPSTVNPPVMLASPPQGSVGSPPASSSSAGVRPEPSPEAKAQALAAFGSSLL